MQVDPDNAALVTDVGLNVGARVVRVEKSWPYGDQDGGVEIRNDGTDGRPLGTVLGFRNAAGNAVGDAPRTLQYAKVQWDEDLSVHMYRIGADGFCLLEYSADQTPVTVDALEESFRQRRAEQEVADAADAEEAAAAAEAEAKKRAMYAGKAP